MNTDKRVRRTDMSMIPLQPPRRHNREKKQEFYILLEYSVIIELQKKT